MNQNNRNQSALLELLASALKKKKEALSVIYTITENQHTVLENTRDMSLSASYFGEMASEKQAYIDEVIKCDDIFQSLFDEVKDAFSTPTDKYNNEVRTLQTLIKEVTDLDVRIRSLELVNKARYHTNVAIRPQTTMLGEARKNDLIGKYKGNSTRKKT